MNLISILALLQRSLLFLAICCVTMLAACTSGIGGGWQAEESREQDPSITLTVFTAASLTEAFTKIAKDFEAEHPGVHVVLNLAGSQQLA